MSLAPVKAAANARRNALKKSVFDAMAKRHMKPVELIQKFDIPSSTAHRWYHVVKNTSSFTDFSRKVGRPSILSDFVVEYVKARVIELTEGRRTPSAEKSSKNVLNMADIIDEGRLKDHKENGAPYLEKLTDKQVYDQCHHHLGMVQAWAQTKTPARIEAITDARNAISMIVCLLYIEKHLKNKAMFFNMDATAFQINGIDRSNKKAKVWVDTSLAQKMKDEGRKISTAIAEREDSAVFIKFHAMVSGCGASAPFCFSVADSTMPAYTTEWIDVQGLAMNMEGKGHIAVHNTRNGTREFYTKYYETIVIPFVNKIRQQSKCEGETAFLWLDGELIQLDPLQQLSMMRLLTQHNIIALKGPASTTEITQVLDASPIFKNAHFKAESADATLSTKANVLLRDTLKAALRDNGTSRNGSRLQGKGSDNSYLQKLVDVLMRATYGLTTSLTPANVVSGLEKTGLSLEKNKCNFAKVLHNFGIKVSKSTEVDSIVDECKKVLLPQFVKYGSVRDKDMEEISFMQSRFAEGEDKPVTKDKIDRAVGRQRCVIVGHEEIEKHKTEAKARLDEEEQRKKDAQKTLRNEERKKKVVKTTSARKIAKTKPPRVIQTVVAEETSLASAIQMGCMTLGYRPQKTSSRSK
jgi:hypothetical protein